MREPTTDGLNTPAEPGRAEVPPQPAARVVPGRRLIHRRVTPGNTLVLGLAAQTTTVNVAAPDATREAQITARAAA
jgi:hypothetical protein